MLSEQAPLLMVVLVTILVIALGANFYFHQQQERKLQRNLLSRKLKNEADKVLTALATLKQINCPPEALNVLNGEVASILTQLSRIKPESGIIDQIQSQTGINTDPLALNLEHPDSMKKAHESIRFAIRFMHQRRSLGALSALKCEEICRELQWLDSQIEIDTHMNAGKRLLESDKAAVATSRFKQAKNFIAKLPHNDARRPTLMIEVNELIAQALPFGTEALKKNNPDETETVED